MIEVVLDCLVSTLKSYRKMASPHKKPSSLYCQCLVTYVKNLNHSIVNLDRINYLRLLPPIVLADIYVQICKNAALRDILMEELSDLNVFTKLIKFGSARQMMFKCFQTLMSDGKPIASELRKKFCQQTQHKYLNKTQQQQQQQQEQQQQNDSESSYMKSYFDQIDCGIRLGTFLSESGWLDECLHVINLVHILIQNLAPNATKNLLELNCLQKLLHAQTAFCCFKEATSTSNLALQIINSNPSNIPNSLLANIYQQISVLHFYRSEYDLSYNWSIKALRHINKDTPDRIIVDVLRQVAKSCVVKRQFQSANMLIQQAVCRARSSFGQHHQKYADALLDYGFFLLNVDSIANSVCIYKEALDILCQTFGRRSLPVAVAHEDLAYALYVLEYSSGRFQCAQHNVERAIHIMKELVPCNHLMLASAKRVKALILEEIALDNMASTVDHDDFNKLLSQSEELHRSALQLSLEAFGEINVQTAKHYGNLGRLYQSMTKFDDAEQMHKRAIKIKTDLLGAYDYEVGLSIGHLASLYNYHMNKHREAEDLYFKSIEINLRLFGDSYSGLEYDYRGLIHIYKEIEDLERYRQYSHILEEWRILREENNDGRKPLYVELKEDTSMEEVTRKFFEMCSDAAVAVANANTSTNSGDGANAAIEMISVT